MYKNLALAAFALASMAAFAQDGNRDWASKYDTYNIGKVDVNGLSDFQLGRIVRHELKQVNQADAFTLMSFVQKLPSDQATAVLRGLASNYKQASIVRDEVAMAKFGTDEPYAWLSYPLLTWTDTPGQNSWTGTTFASNYNSPMGNGDGTIAMTDDNSRPMRMAMARRGDRDIDFDRAIHILGSNLSETDRGSLSELFHPTTTDPLFYTNQSELDAAIRVIRSNAMMADHLDRWAWYNHMNKDYYNGNRMDW